MLFGCCLHRVVLVPFGINCILYLIAVWFWQTIWLREWFLQLPSFFVFCVSKGRAGRSNTFLRTLCFILQQNEVCRPRAVCRLISYCCALARTHDVKNFLSIQVFCCKTFIMLWYDTSNRCLCVQSSTSSPLQTLLYRRLSVLICLQAPASLSLCFCTSFSAAPLRVASLILLLNVEWRSWYITFPASRHSFFHVKAAQFVRWHHSLPTFGSKIALSARMSAPSFADQFSSMHFHFD